MLFMVCQTHISLESLLMPMLVFRCLVFCFFYILDYTLFFPKKLLIQGYFQSFTLYFNQALLYLVSKFVNSKEKQEEKKRKKPRGD